MIKNNHIEESVLYNLELKSNQIKINDLSWLLLLPPPPPPRRASLMLWDLNFKIYFGKTWIKQIEQHSILFTTME